MSLKQSLSGLCTLSARHMPDPSPTPQSLGTLEAMSALFLGAFQIGKAAKHTVQGNNTWKGHTCGMRAETRLTILCPSTPH